MKTNPTKNGTPVADSTRHELSAALETLARLLEYPGADFGARHEEARVALCELAGGGKAGAHFPLTPALSLGERENGSPRLEQASPLMDSRTPFPERTDGGGEAESFGAASQRPFLFPLPEGEGQGEGERIAALSGAWNAFERFHSTVSALSADEREELFTATFDVTPACVAYVSIHLFGEENFKRGEFMAALNARYEQSGFDSGGELPDHLSVLLRFAATIPEEERSELTQFCLLGPIEKMIAAQTPENPYRALLKTVREVFQAAYPGMKPALTPLEQMRQHGTDCSAMSSGCGCGMAQHEPAPSGGAFNAIAKRGEAATEGARTAESASPRQINTVARTQRSALLKNPRGTQNVGGIAVRRAARDVLTTAPAIGSKDTEVDAPVLSGHSSPSEPKDNEPHG